MLGQPFNIKKGDMVMVGHFGNSEPLKIRGKNVFHYFGVVEYIIKENGEIVQEYQNIMTGRGDLNSRIKIAVKCITKIDKWWNSHTSQYSGKFRPLKGTYIGLEDPHGIYMRDWDEEIRDIVRAAWKEVSFIKKCLVKSEYL